MFFSQTKCLRRYIPKSSNNPIPLFKEYQKQKFKNKAPDPLTKQFTQFQKEKKKEKNNTQRIDKEKRQAEQNT